MRLTPLGNHGPIPLNSSPVEKVLMGINHSMFLKGLHLPKKLQHPSKDWVRWHDKVYVANTSSIWFQTLFFLPGILSSLSLINATYRFSLSFSPSFLSPPPSFFPFLHLFSKHLGNLYNWTLVFITLKLSSFMLDFHSRSLVFLK